MDFGFDKYLNNCNIWYDYPIKWDDILEDSNISMKLYGKLIINNDNNEFMFVLSDLVKVWYKISNISDEVIRIENGKMKFSQPVVLLNRVYGTQRDKNDSFIGYINPTNDETSFRCDCTLKLDNNAVAHNMSYELKQVQDINKQREYIKNEFVLPFMSISKQLSYIVNNKSNGSINKTIDSSIMSSLSSEVSNQQNEYDIYSKNFDLCELKDLYENARKIHNSNKETNVNEGIIADHKINDDLVDAANDINTNIDDNDVTNDNNNGDTSFDINAEYVETEEEIRIRLETARKAKEKAEKKRKKKKRRMV